MSLTLEVNRLYLALHARVWIMITFINELSRRMLRNSICAR